MNEFEIPVAGWRVLRTACDVCRDEGELEDANRYRALAQEMIMTIADSFEPDEPLRASFLGNPAICRVFEESMSA